MKIKNEFMFKEAKKTKKPYPTGNTKPTKNMNKAHTERIYRRSN